MRRLMSGRSTGVGLLAGVAVGGLVVGISRPVGATSCVQPREVAELQLESIHLSRLTDAAIEDAGRWPQRVTVFGYNDPDFKMLYLRDGEGYEDRTIELEGFEFEGGP